MGDFQVLNLSNCAKLELKTEINYLSIQSIDINGIKIETMKNLPKSEKLTYIYLN